MRLETRGRRRPLKQRTPSPEHEQQRAALGAQGEALAAAHLEALGYALIERNWRKNGGEVDLIALHPSEPWLVFVEVRARRGSYVTPELSVTPGKQRRVVRQAERYLSTRIGQRYADRVVTFDVVGIILPEGAITHIPCAFEAW